MRLLLHDYWRSSACFRVRIGLNLKGLAYDSVEVNLRDGDQKTDAFRHRNPQGLIPFLEAGDVHVGQSLAILDYLDALQPDPRFVPKNAADRAHVLAMALHVACDIHPLNNLRVLKYLEHELHLSEPARDGWYEHWVREGLTSLNIMAAPRAGKFLFGDEPGLADICLIPQLYNARRFNVEVEDLGLLLAVEEAALSLDAFASALPERVKPD